MYSTSIFTTTTTINQTKWPLQEYQEQKIMDALSQTPSPNTFSEEESYFSDATSFRSHRLPQSNSLRCSICQRRFHSQGNLSNHNQLYH